MRQRIAALAVGALLSVAVTAAAQIQSANVRQHAMGPYRTALEYMRSETWEQSAKAFREAIEIDPSFEMAYYGLGRVLMPQRKFVEAVSAYVKCRDLYLSQAGRQFTNQHDAQRARRDQITEIDEQIRVYQQGFQTPQMTDAIRQLQERRRTVQFALDRGTNLDIDATVPVFVSLALGSAYFRLGQLPDAEREYKAAIAVDPKAGEAFSNLAVVYLETGRFDDAERAVAAARKAGFKVNPQLEDDIKSRKRGRG